MRLALHIFTKDIRRLWWETAVTLALLSWLARMDCQRADFLAGSMEGWLNLLLPAAWSYLAALLIHEEALVGDRQFWITRPYPRPALLAAKVLFLLAFIHLPSFFADGVILAARGFQPLHYVQVLFWKQVILVVALTLPAAALAALTGGLAQFVLAALVIVGAAVALAGAVEPVWAPWIAVDEVRRRLAWAPLAVAAVVILWLQYSRRRTALSRTVGIAAIFPAGLLFACLPREYTFAVRCALSAVPTGDRPLSIDVKPGRERLRYAVPPNTEVVSIPIGVSGLPPATRVRLEQLEFEIIGPHGDRWKRVAPQSREDMVQASISLGDRNEGWQHVRLARSIYDRIGNGGVQVNGKVGATFYQEGEAFWMPLFADARAAPGLGRCWSVLVLDQSGGEMVKAVCESPVAIPLLTRVKLVHPGSGREWNQRLGDSMTSVPYPMKTWLSPLQRRQTFFHITDATATAEGSRWLVPRDVLSEAKIALVVEQVTACQTLRYEMRDLNLAEFVVKRPPR